MTVSQMEIKLLKSIKNLPALVEPVKNVTVVQAEPVKNVTALAVPSKNITTLAEPSKNFTALI